jgi:AcrR family transcriptional regulator
MNTRAPTRPYSSTLRAEQADQTRVRIVQAAVDLLSEGDAGDLSMNDVAARAGVSVRTVYRNFATRDELLDGVIGWIGDRLNSRAGPAPSTRDEYEKSTPDVIRALFEIEPLYRALFATSAGRESHQRGNAARRNDITGAFGTEMAGMTDGEAHRFVALMHLVSSSNGALFLKDYWALPDDEIVQAMRWAIVTLADAARDSKRRQGL